MPLFNFIDPKFENGYFEKKYMTGFAKLQYRIQLSDHDYCNSLGPDPDLRPRQSKVTRFHLWVGSELGIGTKVEGFTTFEDSISLNRYRLLIFDVDFCKNYEETS